MQLNVYKKRGYSAFLLWFGIRKLMIWYSIFIFSLEKMFWCTLNRKKFRAARTISMNRFSRWILGMFSIKVYCFHQNFKGGKNLTFFMYILNVQFFRHLKCLMENDPKKKSAWTSVVKQFPGYSVTATRQLFSTKIRSQTPHKRYSLKSRAPVFCVCE